MTWKPQTISFDDALADLSPFVAVSQYGASPSGTTKRRTACGLLKHEPLFVPGIGKDFDVFPFCMFHSLMLRRCFSRFQLSMLSLEISLSEKETVSKKPKD